MPRSVADYTYGYAQALADHVVRPVLFMAYSGEMQWRTRAGDEVAARLGEPLTKDLTAQALRTALDPRGPWMPSVLAAADTPAHRGAPARARRGRPGDRLRPGLRARLRRAAGGDHRREADRGALRREGRLASGSRTFADGDDRWMVAVRMVSEGVDVPRLAVGVYATTTATPLFFAQAVGRFVRARRRGETASVFLPSVPHLLGLAAEMEVERDHVLRRPVTDEDDIFAAEEDLLAAAQAAEPASGEELLQPFEALGSEARFDRVLYDGGEFGHAGEVHVGSEEEMDFLGIPGLLEPDQVRDLLHQRQTRPGQAAAARPRPERPTTSRDVATHEQLAVLRRELNGLVAAWNHRTGQPHGVTHAALRKECGGPAGRGRDRRPARRRGSTGSGTGPPSAADRRAPGA